MSPMNPSRWTVSPLLVLALFLTVAPFDAAVASAQTLREASQTEAAVAAASEAQPASQSLSQSQTKSCVAQARDWLKECEEEAAKEEADNRDGRRERSGLGWTGIGLISAGSALVISAATVDRWRSCGPLYRRTCQSIERRQGISGGTMLATGLTFLIIDEVRRHPEPYRTRQTSIAIGPRAIQVSMRF